MKATFSKISGYIDSHREEIIEKLSSLAKIPSVSKAGKDSYPFSKEVDDALNLAASFFNESGMDMMVKSDSGYAIYTSNGIGDGIGLFAHADVVPVNDDWIKTSPFEPICENGYIFGRGVSDNKAGVIASLYALKALKAADVKLNSKITVYIGGSEETGMQDIEAFCKNEKMPAVCITPDSDFPVSVGEKGIMHIAVRSKKNFEDVSEFCGGMAYNVILDNVKVKAKTEEFEVRGLTAHAAHPEGSENAAYKAAQQLLNKEISQNDKKLLSDFCSIIEGYYGKGLNIESEGVFGKLTSVNGIVKIDEGKLFFTIDIRYGNEVDSKKTEETIRRVLEEKDFEVVSLENNEGFLLDEGGKDMEIILNACREVCEKPEAMPYKTYGGTYARHLRNAFAIDHSAPWDKSGLNLPEGHGGAHQSDEVLCVDAFLSGIKALAVMIEGLDEEYSK